MAKGLAKYYDKSTELAYDMYKESYEVAKTHNLDIKEVQEYTREKLDDFLNERS